MVKPKLIAVLVLAFLVLIVLFQNRAAVETKILFFSVTMPRALLLLITVTLGFSAGAIVALSFFKNKDR